MAAGAGWTRPHGHPVTQAEGVPFEEIVEPIESPRPSRPVSSDEIDAAAETAAGVEAARELKGEELDKALEEADLPKTGSADEKRDRLAKHRASAGESPE